MKNLLDQMSPADQAKAKSSATRRQKRSKPLSREWFFLGEFGYYFGFEGVRAVLENYIDTTQAEKLLEGARKVHASHMIDLSYATRVATIPKAQDYTRSLQPFLKAVQEVA